MRGSWSAATLALVVLSVPAPALAATAATAANAAAPAAPPETFGEQIDVRAVDVFAAVTDRSGRRVTGLTAADFRLRVDGKEVPIDSFGAVEPGRPAPAGGVGGAEPPTAATAVGRNFLVFVDNGFSIAAQRDQVLQNLSAQLAQLGPDDRMAVVAFDGDRLLTVAEWTGNRATLAAAFATVKTLPSHGLGILTYRRSDAEDRRLAAEYDPILAARAAFGSLGRLTLESPELRNPAEARALVKGMPRVLAAVDATLRTLVPPPGRRVLLLLSGGWPFSTYPALLWPLTATANRLGYTFYPVDVPGLDPEVTGADARQAFPMFHDGFISTAWERDSDYTLELLARATGGKAFLHSARLDALARADEDTRSYYRLGFSPAWKADDHEHRIEVQVRRPGLSVRARKSYVDLSGTSEAALEQQRRELFVTVEPGGAAADEPPPAGPTALEN